MERKKPANNRESEVGKLGDLQVGRLLGENSHSLLKGLAIAFSWEVSVGWSEGASGFWFGC